MSLRRLMRSIVRDLLPYAELDTSTPSGLFFQIPDRGAWSSVTEVFIARVYDRFYRHLGGVRHWVDLGSNQGFFSFGLLEHLNGLNGQRPETKVFLGDANLSCVERVRGTIERNGLKGKWRCEHVIIGPPNTTVKFEQHKDSLHSNIFSVGRTHKNFHYPTTDLSSVLSKEQGVFDLIKMDIEGAEKFLFEHHADLLKRFRYGLCEWHAPAFPGTELEKHLKKLNWRVVDFHSSEVKYDVSQGHSWNSPLGTVLWENPNPAG